MFPSAYMRPSLFSRGLQASKAINWSGLLDGTQKTLGVINQAIPIVYQVKPLIGNAKAIFKIADALNNNNDDVVRNDSSLKTEKITNNDVSDISRVTNTNRPIFYV